MTQIKVLEQATIDKIAAGEVVERPSSIVKELCENAIDAGASAITVEIRDGGISLIRVTDNGEGIDPGQIRTAFLRHATSKITKVDDLLTIRSFGFRGEALSSIAAVSRVELITKTREQLTGIRYKVEGGTELLYEEIGAPEGSTFLVRDLFYNTPARRKFLKSAQTEAGAVSDFCSRLALSHPEVSVKFMVNGTTRLSTSGSGSQKDVIYAAFGRDITANLIEVDRTDEARGMRMTGWIGKPQISRGNRTHEILFVNGRLIFNSVLSRAIEDGYETFLMQHRFPFVILSLTLPGDRVDVNVHPAKAQVRFSDGPSIYEFVKSVVKDALTHRELIIDTTFGSVKEEEADKKAARKRALEAAASQSVPEPFEKLRREHEQQNDSPYGRKYPQIDRQRQSSGERIARSNEFLKEVSQLSIFDQVGGTEAIESKDASAPSGVRADLQGVSALSLDRSDPGSSVPSSDRSDPGTSVLSSDQDDPKSPSVPSSDQADSKRASVPSSDVADPFGAYAPLPDPADAGRAYSGENAFSRPDPEPREGQTVRYGTSVEGPRTESGSSIGGVREPGFEYGTESRDSQAKFLSQQHRDEHRLIGQLFETYWIVEFRDHMYIIDQHAAHEKVMFERLMARYRAKQAASQMLSPSILISLTMAEEDQLREHMDLFRQIGFEIEHFGGRDYAISAVPVDLYGLTETEFFREMLDSLSADAGKQSIETISARVAGMACKAAVKGNTRLSTQEARELIAELLTLDNPYNCPHGRPTILSMSRTEIEKKFHRIV